MWFTTWLQQRTAPSAHPRSKRARRQATRARQAVPRLQVEQLEERWCPSFTLVTSRTALAGTDYVDWGSVGPPGTVVANPSTILSPGGRSITVSHTQSGGSFETCEQSPPTMPVNCIWQGNFAPGDIVLYTAGDSPGTKSNHITLNFGATPVAAGGAQISTAASGKLTAEVDALDAKGNTLASFKEDGNSTSAADNSAIFIGVSSSSANIYQIDLFIQSGTRKADFAINKFDFRSSVVAAAPAISQPASAMDLAPLASSLLSTGPPALPAAPLSGFAAPSAPPISQSGGLPTSDTTSAVHVGATDAVFAVSHAPASDDNAWLLAPLSFGSLDAM